jgi:hypothetical protein
MTPEYYYKLAAVWLRLAEMEHPYSRERPRLRKRAVECMRRASKAEADAQRASDSRKEQK